MRFAQAAADLEEAEKQKSRKSGKIASYVREALEGKYYCKHEEKSVPRGEMGGWLLWEGRTGI